MTNGYNSGPLPSSRLWVFCPRWVPRCCGQPWSSVPNSVMRSFPSHDLELHKDTCRLGNAPAGPSFLCRAHSCTSHRNEGPAGAEGEPGHGEGLCHLLRVPGWGVLGALATRPAGGPAVCAALSALGTRSYAPSISLPYHKTLQLAFILPTVGLRA